MPEEIITKTTVISGDIFEFDIFGFLYKNLDNFLRICEGITERILVKFLKKSNKVCVRVRGISE